MMRWNNSTQNTGPPLLALRLRTPYAGEIMMNRILRVCLPAAMLFVLLPGVAAARTAAAPTCGATITTSITLHAALNCSAGGTNGLNVGANGIVIKLNGFSIIGAGGADGYYGIYNNGYNNVRVNGRNKITGKNGKIRNFAYDYVSSNAQGERVANVRLVLDGSKNYVGLSTHYGTGNIYSYDTVTNAANGFEVSGSGNKFVHNTLTGNGNGASVGAAFNDTWTANNFSYNAGIGYYHYLYDGTTTLTGNTASHNGNVGFQLVCGSGHAVVKNNIANYNGGGGISSIGNDVYCSPSTFTGNKTNRNVGAGIFSQNEANATFNLNRANANTTYGFAFAVPFGYVITANASNGNGSDGVYLYATSGSSPSQVANNSSSSNGGYGYNADALVTGSGNTGSTNTSGLFNNVSG